MKVLHLLLFKKKSIYFKITDFFNTNDIKAVQIAQPLSDPSFSLLASIKWKCIFFYDNSYSYISFKYLYAFIFAIGILSSKTFFKFPE